MSLVALLGVPAALLAACEPGERTPLPADQQGYGGDQQGPPRGVPRGSAEDESRYDQGSRAGGAPGAPGIGGGVPEVDEDPGEDSEATGGRNDR